MAKEQSILPKIGSWAFIIGVLVAILIGLFSKMAASNVIMSVLVVMGLIVGFLNVNGRETMTFLLAAVSLVIVTSFGGNVVATISGVGPYLQGILNAMVVFIVPATIVVALKAIYALAYDN